MGALLAIARADFRERVRRSSFLILLAATVAAAYGFVPARSAGYVTFSYGRIGGVYNSAWIGTLVASLDMVVLSLFGFFVVRDAVERDERTGVGQILATTPMTRLQYTLGKFLSNVLVLGCAVAVTVVMAALMQELRGEVRRLDVVELLLPFVVMVLPGLALVSALAVLFETFRPLRGVKGGVLYFFLWIGVLTLPVAQAHSGHPKPWLDPFGWSAPMAGIQKDVRAHFSDYDGGINVGVTVSPVPLRTFVWEGLDWAPVTPWRLLFVLLAAALAALAALPFHRFDPERMPRRTAAGRRVSSRAARSLGRRWTPLFERLAGRSRTLTLVWAELALLVRGRRTGWGMGLRRAVAGMPALAARGGAPLSLAGGVALALGVLGRDGRPGGAPPHRGSGLRLSSAASPTPSLCVRRGPPLDRGRRLGRSTSLFRCAVLARARCLGRGGMLHSGAGPGHGGAQRGPPPL